MPSNFVDFYDAELARQNAHVRVGTALLWIQDALSTRQWLVRWDGTGTSWKGNFAEDKAVVVFSNRALDNPKVHADHEALHRRLLR